MSRFALKEIKVEGAVHQFYALVRDGKCLYDDFLEGAKNHFHIPKDKELAFHSDKDEVIELETLIEDISLNNLVLPKCHKPLNSISKQINYQAHEIRTSSSMLRVYYVKEKRTGKIIILGHIKKNKKDQGKELKRVVNICKDYHDFQLKNEVKILK